MFRLVWFSVGDMIATVVELSSVVVIVAVGNMLRKLHTSDPVCVCVCVHSDMKNAVIGNNKQKANLIVLGAVPRCLSPFTCFPHLLSFPSPQLNLQAQLNGSVDCVCLSPGYCICSSRARPAQS